MWLYEQEQWIECAQSNANIGLNLLSLYGSSPLLAICQPDSLKSKFVFKVIGSSWCNLKNTCQYRPHMCSPEAYPLVGDVAGMLKSSSIAKVKYLLCTELFVAMKDHLTGLW